MLDASGSIGSGGYSSASVLDSYYRAERGRIFQDSQGATVLNTNPDKDLKVSGDTGVKQWGFRFMYNPTSFSYSSASNNQVDWTLGSKDPTLLLTGNQTVEFELYINRIADMSFLRQIKNLDDTKRAYPRALYQEEVDGILHRGTEYDIEFLYRVLNGDPLKDPLLFGPNYKGRTADFGFTTAVPCWLVLNDNLRYYGSVANFRVNHVMFDLNMVPMLTVMSVSFSRYPALWGSSYNKDSQWNTQQGISSTIINDVAKSTTGTGVNN